MDLHFLLYVFINFPVMPVLLSFFCSIQECTGTCTINCPVAHVKKQFSSFLFCLYILECNNVHKSTLEILHINKMWNHAGNKDYVRYCLQRILQYDSYPRTDPITVPANQPRNPKFDRNNPHTAAEKRRKLVMMQPFIALYTWYISKLTAYTCV